jgi:hypothetical protein
MVYRGLNVATSSPVSYTSTRPETIKGGKVRHVIGGYPCKRREKLLQNGVKTNYFSANRTLRLPCRQTLFDLQDTLNNINI